METKKTNQKYCFPKCLILFFVSIFAKRHFPFCFFSIVEKTIYFCFVFCLDFCEATFLSLFCLNFSEKQHFSFFFCVNFCETTFLILFLSQIFAKQHFWFPFFWSQFGTKNNIQIFQVINTASHITLLVRFVSIWYIYE